MAHGEEAAVSALPTLEYTSRGVIIRAPYHPKRTPRLAAALKKRIPEQAREYNPTRMTWRIWKRYADVARRAMIETLGDVRVVGDPKAGGDDYIQHHDGARTTQALLF